LLEVEAVEVGGDWVQSLYRHRHAFPSGTEAPNSNDNHNDNDDTI